MPHGRKIDLKNCSIFLKDRASTFVSTVLDFEGYTSPSGGYARACVSYGEYVYYFGLSSGPWEYSRTIYRTQDCINWEQVNDGSVFGNGLVIYAWVFKDYIYFDLSYQDIFGNTYNRLYKTQDCVNLITVIDSQYAFYPSVGQVTVSDDYIYTDTLQYFSEDGSIWYATGATQPSISYIGYSLHKDGIFYTVAQEIDELFDYTISTVYTSTDLQNWVLLKDFTEAGFNTLNYIITYQNGYFYMMGQNNKYSDTYCIARTVDFETFEYLYTGGDLLQFLVYHDNNFFTTYTDIFTLRNITETTRNFLEVKVGDGELYYREQRQFEYLHEKRKLDQVKEGEDIPLTLSFKFNWEFLRSNTDSLIPTIEEVLKRQGPASNWISTTDDTYTLDMVLEESLCDGSGETTLFSDFSYNRLTHSIRDSSINCEGSCKITEATSLRS